VRLVGRAIGAPRHRTVSAVEPFTSRRVPPIGQRPSLHLTSGAVSAALAVLLPESRNHSELRIEGLKASGEEIAERLLRSAVDALDFQLSRRFDFGMKLIERAKSVRIDLNIQSANPLCYPQHRYSSDALAYYKYGRAACHGGLPLLEFLAYYQVVEYFFPAHANTDTLRRLRDIIADPGRNPTDDGTLNRIVGLFGKVGRSGMREGEQLRIIIRDLLDEDDVREWLEGGPWKDHFTKLKVVRGVERINLACSARSLREQVADRLYAIRCRIVHAKTFSATMRISAISGWSREASSLEGSSGSAKSSLNSLRHIPRPHLDTPPGSGHLTTPAHSQPAAPTGRYRLPPNSRSRNQAEGLRRGFTCRGRAVLRIGRGRVSRRWSGSPGSGTCPFGSGDAGEPAGDLLLDLRGPQSSFGVMAAAGLVPHSCRVSIVRRPILHQQTGPEDMRRGPREQLGLP
jgi:hypothetical protein